jgi:hypothetical protein
VLAELPTEECTQVGLGEPLRLQRVRRVIVGYCALRARGGRDDSEHEEDAATTPAVTTIAVRFTAWTSWVV